MEFNIKEMEAILSDPQFDSVICLPLESRPGELAKYICALANGAGGYVLIGVARENGAYQTVGFRLVSHIEDIMNAAYEKLSPKVTCRHGSILLSGQTVFVIRVERSENLVLADGICYTCVNHDAKVMEPTRQPTPSTLFISYTECDAPIVDIIEQAIRNQLQDKIKISRYTELTYKASFKAFMNTIQDHDFVLTVVSDTYLKKQPCMYEVGEIIKDRHYQNKLLFVVLSESERPHYGEHAPVKIGPDVYGGPEARLEYIGYWKDRYERLKHEMRQIDDFEATGAIAKDLQIIGQIYRRDMGEFLNFLSDENGKSFQHLYSTGFKEMIDWIAAQ